MEKFELWSNMFDLCALFKNELCIENKSETEFAVQFLNNQSFIQQNNLHFIC